jgi:heterodisulfide reductase subunit A
VTSPDVGTEKKRPRVGVYVCHCGGNISDYVDVKEVVKELSKEADVVVAKDLMFDCSDASQAEMIEDVKGQGLDRIVIAACSPKLHEMTFRGTAQRAGLNPYMFYHANIREQSSWAHEDDHRGATDKALGHARAAVAYARLAVPLERPKIQTRRAVLVVGGGVAGIKAALDLSGMGIEVMLAERSSRLGGHVSELGEVYPYGREGPEIVGCLVEELTSRDNVTVFTNATVESWTGYIGSFDVKVRVTRGSSPSGPPAAGDGANPDRIGEIVEIQVGSVVVATGFEPFTPARGEFGYGTVKGVVTLPEFEALKGHGLDGELVYQGRHVRDIAYIYCVGSRQAEGSSPQAGDGQGQPKVNRYCSRYCCNAAINSSLAAGRRYPGLTTYHLYRDIRTYGRNELMYEEACREGSIFIRFDEQNPPSVTEEGDRCEVVVKSSLLENQPVRLKVDLVVLVTGMVPRSNEGLNALLALPIGSDGFYKEIHQKLRPVETNTAGLLIAGTAQGPKDIRESLSSASAASAKAAAIALKRELELEPFIAEVDSDRCENSQACVKECPYEAIEMRDQGFGAKASVNGAKCKGCGACVALCPTEAIQLRGLTNGQVRSMIEAMAR